MRFALITVMSLALVAGCSGESVQPLPTAPVSTTTTSVTPAPPVRPPVLASIWVVVIEAGGTGACIPGAIVEIVRGQGTGRSLTQTTGFCSYWDPDERAFFTRLNPGEESTLRASASGYAAKEMTVVATLAEQPATAIELSRTP